ncbi:MAG: hypothetical protein PHH12_01855 [Candidatus Shapirobacteria bacterium]|nr:hypothetical protein [Candidatus Shapirobacteria bacterium]
MDSKNIKYLILTIILLILSVFGIFLIFKINPLPLNLIIPADNDEITDIIPTPILESNKPIESIPTETSKLSITPTLSIKPTSTIIPTPTATSSALSLFKSTDDSFSVNYSSSRKLYQDKETTGNRYTFYSSLGNFAVHVAPSGTWSWSNTNRSFSSDFIVSGQNTFRYEINTQTIVDLQSSTKNYTLQCIHNGNESLKTECESFFKSFQLL